MATGKHCDVDALHHTNAGESFLFTSVSATLDGMEKFYMEELLLFQLPNCKVFPADYQRQGLVLIFATDDSVIKANDPSRLSHLVYNT